MYNKYKIFNKLKVQKMKNIIIKSWILNNKVYNRCKEKLILIIMQILKLYMNNMYSKYNINNKLNKYNVFNKFKD